MNTTLLWFPRPHRLALSSTQVHRNPYLPAAATYLGTASFGDHRVHVDVHVLKGPGHDMIFAVWGNFFLEHYRFGSIIDLYISATVHDIVFAQATACLVDQRTNVKLEIRP